MSGKGFKCFITGAPLSAVLQRVVPLRTVPPRTAPLSAVFVAAVLLTAVFLMLPACAGTDENRDGSFSSDQPFPPSGLGAALDTIGTRQLEDWVGEHPDDIEALNVLYGRYALANEHEKLVDYARPIFRKALAEGKDVLAIYTGTYIGQSFSMLFRPDSMYAYFDLIYDKAKRLELKFPLLVINNMIGVSNLTYSMNYSEALYYFYEALKYSDEGNPRNRLQILWNIVNTYYLREDSEYLKSDPEGEQYALEIYRYGKENDDDYILYMGSLACAYMYYVKGEYETALDYVARTESLDTYKSGINSSDALHGTILASLGRNAEAEEYFRRSIERAGEDYSTLVESYLSYGNFLMSCGRYEEAIANYKEGIEVTEKYSLFFYGHRLYDALSGAYAEIGEDSLSVKYMRTYRAIVDSVFNVEKERSFSSLRRSYELEKHKNEVQELDIRILKEKRKWQSLAFLVVFIAMVAVGIILWQRKQQLVYKRLVRSYDANLRTSDRMESIQMPFPATDGEERKQENVFRDVPEEEEAQESRPDAGQKLYEIFESAERCMKEEQIFRDSALTVDNFAKKLNTNRAYLSKAVNTFAKVSFSDYLNAYRIRYAVRLLSDKNDDRPIKVIADQAGYNNLQSFYQNFRKETGVPPSRYRTEILKLKKEQSV